MFEFTLGECQKDPDPDPVLKILICWIRIRPKVDRIRNPACTIGSFVSLAKFLLSGGPGVFATFHTFAFREMWWT